MSWLSSRPGLPLTVSDEGQQRRTRLTSIVLGYQVNKRILVKFFSTDRLLRDDLRKLNYVLTLFVFKCVFLFIGVEMSSEFCFTFSVQKSLRPITIILESPSSNRTEFLVYEKAQPYLPTISRLRELNQLALGHYFVKRRPRHVVQHDPAFPIYIPSRRSKVSTPELVFLKLFLSKRQKKIALYCRTSSITLWLSLKKLLSQWCRSLYWISSFFGME